MLIIQRGGPMSKLNDIESNGQIEEIIKGNSSQDNSSQMEYEPWGTGLSSLLTLPPSVPFLKFSERRSGQDRRAADRRLLAREFKAADESE